MRALKLCVLFLKLCLLSVITCRTLYSCETFSLSLSLSLHQVTGRALAYGPIGGSEACAEIVSEAFTALNTLVLGTAPDWGSDDSIPQALRPCNSMTNELDLSLYQVLLFVLSIHQQFIN